MKILHELSWLWETLGIALFAAAFVSANGTKSAGRSARGRLGSSEIQLEPKTDGVLLGDGIRRFRYGDKA